MLYEITWRRGNILYLLLHEPYFYDGFENENPEDWRATGKKTNTVFSIYFYFLHS